MKEIRPLTRMIQISFLFTLPVLLIAVFLDLKLSGVIYPYFLGSFSAVCGYLSIWFQFQQSASYWIAGTIIGFFFRMAFYGAGIFLCIFMNWNPLFYLAGFLPCRYSLYFFNHRR